MKYVWIVMVEHRLAKCLECLEAFETEYKAESFADEYREDVHGRYHVTIKCREVQ